jgi:acetyltransferase
MLIRPIRPEDEPTLARFHAGLSTQTVVARYGIDRPLAERTSHDRLTRICFADYDRQFAIVAEVLKDEAAAPEFAAIARVSRVHASDDRHLTMTVADAWQRRGVGACLIRTAITVAKGEGVANLVSEFSPRNVRMRELLAAEGFTFDDREGIVVATLPIQ